MRISPFSKMLLVVLCLVCFASACGNVPAGLTPKSGTLLNVEVKTDEPNLEEITVQAVKVLQNRLNAIGANGEVSKTLPNRIEIKIYEGADIQKVKNVLLAGSKLELRKVVTPPSPAPLQTFPNREAAIQSLGGTLPASRKILKLSDSEHGSTQQWVIVENPAIVDGSQLRDASAYPSLAKDGSYQIMFSLKPEGAQKFGDWTGKNINNYGAIVLNDEVKSAAYIKSQIFDSAMIEGRFTKQAAEDLVLVLKSGYLPATLQLIDEKTF
jgi:preprotein translocase subunit SecD